MVGFHEANSERLLSTFLFQAPPSNMNIYFSVNGITLALHFINSWQHVDLFPQLVPPKPDEGVPIHEQVMHLLKIIIF